MVNGNDGKQKYIGYIKGQIFKHFSVSTIAINSTSYEAALEKATFIANGWFLNANTISVKVFLLDDIEAGWERFYKHLKDEENVQQ